MVLFSNIHIFKAIATLFCMVNSTVNSQNSFEFVVLPDSQTLVEEFPEVYKSQMEWIVNQKDRFSFVLHVGDITQNNSEEEWEVAKSGLSLLNQKVPYNLALGNHDMGSQPGKFADTRNTVLANTYFPINQYIKNSNSIATFPENTIDNSCAEYNLAGTNWLVFSLEFGPRNKTIDWANNIIEKYPEHRIIVNTHSYMYNDNTLQDGDDWYLPQKYGVGKAIGEDAVNDGGQLWEKFIKKNKNIRMVFSGHILGSGVGQLVSQNDYGLKVYQMLANYQKNVKGVERGDSGYLRLIKVNKNDKTISVKTYSPWLKTFKTEPEHEFTFKDVNI
ncbi:metallophosphoesterase [Sabulilitoribacter multivorans]|uniref:Metallophosphoesterase n=1 Tax=Flaviramulus multivorans TaxID=1304750 RepID=A0ABS9IIR8_9FLAO|nr:metallophosphoesterase [Flaviramulus multivorans]MCF7560451.1 metallophosphoesterase [Flaviramulus multivorans]